MVSDVRSGVETGPRLEAPQSRIPPDRRARYASRKSDLKSGADPSEVIITTQSRLSAAQWEVEPWCNADDRTETAASDVSATEIEPVGIDCLSSPGVSTSSTTPVKSASLDRRKRRR
jgi:hypothetical protein